MSKPLFISFEGGDGSGKTTMINIVNDFLKTNGYETVVTREPGGCVVSEEIRKVILDYNVDSKTEALLFAAARHEHILQTIKPALTSNKVVLCDRFVESSLIYQGVGRGLTIPTIQLLNNWILEDTKPDLIIYLKIDHHIAQARMKNRLNQNNRIDNESDEFHKQINDAYDNLFVNYDNVLIVDASQDIKVIGKIIINKIKDLLK